MYPRPVVASATGTATLAQTGLSIGWLVMLALMMLVLGTTLVKLIPRRQLELTMGQSGDSNQVGMLPVGRHRSS